MESGYAVSRSRLEEDDDVQQVRGKCYRNRQKRMRLGKAGHKATEQCHGTCLQVGRLE